MQNQHKTLVLENLFQKSRIGSEPLEQVARKIHNFAPTKGMCKEDILMKARLMWTLGVSGSVEVTVGNLLWVGTDSFTWRKFIVNQVDL